MPTLAPTKHQPNAKTTVGTLTPTSEPLQLNLMKPFRLEQYITQYLDKMLLSYGNSLSKRACRARFRMEVDKWLANIEERRGFLKFSTAMAYNQMTFEFFAGYEPNDLTADAVTMHKTYYIDPGCILTAAQKSITVPTTITNDPLAAFDRAMEIVQ